MANLCDTTYKCVGSLKEVRELHKVLTYIDKKKTSILKNGFGKWWLGNLVHKLGGDWEKYRCRGEITDYSLDGNILTIYQETAWCEQEGIRKIIEEKFPSIKVYFMEEESGCGVYYTNDSSGEFFPERYFLDSYEDCEYFETIEEAAKYVSEIVGHEVDATVNTIEKELDEYMKKHEEDEVWFSFHEFTIIS